MPVHLAEDKTSDMFRCSLKKLIHSLPPDPPTNLNPATRHSACGQSLAKAPALPDYGNA